MSNLDYIRTLSAEELVDWIDGERVMLIRSVNLSREYLIEWLNATREDVEI